MTLYRGIYRLSFGQKNLIQALIEHQPKLEIESIRINPEMATASELSVENRMMDELESILAIEKLGPSDRLEISYLDKNGASWSNSLQAIGLADGSDQPSPTPSPLPSPSSRRKQNSDNARIASISHFLQVAINCESDCNIADIVPGIGEQSLNRAEAIQLLLALKVNKAILLSEMKAIIFIAKAKLHSLQYGPTFKFNQITLPSLNLERGFISQAQSLDPTEAQLTTLLNSLFQNWAETEFNRALFPAKFKLSLMYSSSSKDLRFLQTEDWSIEEEVYLKKMDII